MDQGSDQKKALGRIALQQRSTGGMRSPRHDEEDEPPDLEALKALSDQFGVPGIDLSQVCIRVSDLELLPREIAERHAILPVLVRDDRVFVAMVSPGDKRIIDELEFVTGKKVFPYVALPNELQRALTRAYDLKNRGEAFYVGPRCPEETMRRMGAIPPEQEAAPPAINEANDAPDVVVDDATDKAARTAELNDGEFGNMTGDVSVVTDLPGSLPAGAAPVSESQPRSGARTILVVDDEPDIRKMLARLLKDKGYHVVEADRGLQALRIVKEQVPDIIILDAMLPEVHGFEIARRIRGSQKYGHIPIIMISAVYRGWRYAEDVKSSYGVNAYIEKPFRIADILKAIDDVASKQAKAPDESESTNASIEAEKALAAGVAAYQAGDIDGAIAHLKRGIGIDPLAYRMHFHLALLCGKKGQVYEAIQHLERALDINPRHFPAMKNLAVLYQKAGFRNKAIETWERAIGVAPDEATRQSIKELLLGLL